MILDVPDRGLRDIEPLLRFVDRHADAAEHPGAEAGGHVGAGGRVVRVGEPATHRDRRGLGIDLIVEKVDGATVGKRPLDVIDESHHHRHRVGRCGRSGGGVAEVIPEADEGRLVEVEVDEDRIDRHDGGEGRLILVDEVADLELRPPDEAVDRGHDRAELDVQPGRFHLGAGRGQRPGVLLELGLVGVEFLLARRPLGDELRVAVDLHLAEAAFPEELLDAALGLEELGLIGPGIDLVKPIPGFDELAIPEGNLREVAGDPAPDVDGGNGFDPPGDLDPFRRDAGLEGNDRHFGHGRRRRRRSRWPCASAQKKAPPDNDRMDRERDCTAPGASVRMAAG